jgi:hypothetical protein
MEQYMDGSLPPENYKQWQTACEALCTLEKLRLLRIDMTVWSHRTESTNDVQHSALIFIFSALKGVKAQTFQVELNMSLPNEVGHALGTLPFEILLHERTYDWRALKV